MTQSAPQTPSSDYLLSPTFLRKLEQATLSSRRILAGRTRGERRSARRGSSVEFADYRAYTPGDDLRYLDWAAFARLQRLFLKLFLEEEDLHVYVLLDGTGSMEFGQPQKFRWAQQAAAALGYMSLCSGDRLQCLAHLESEGISSRSFRGKGAALEAFAWLNALQAGGETSLPTAARWLSRVIPAPGLLFVVSDLLTDDWEEALSRLAVSGCEVCMLQVFSRQEVEPDLRGDLRLVDAETAAEREITMGSSVYRRYMKERDEFLGAVQKCCNRYGFSYLFSVTDESVEEMVLKSLRRLGVVR